MDIDILRHHPEFAKDISITVKGADLLNFAETLITETANKVKEAVRAENKPDDLLTRQQVAEMLGVTLTTLWHYDRKNVLNPVRIGSKVRYRRSDIEKALSK